MMKKLSTFLLFLLATISLVGCNDPKPSPDPDPKPDPEVVYDYDIKPVIVDGEYTVDPLLDGLANYFIVFSEIEIGPNMTFTKAGNFIALDMYAMGNPEMLLTAGKYDLIGQEDKPAELALTPISMLGVVGSDLQAVYNRFEKATAEVSIEGKVTTILFTGTTVEGKNVRCKYTGEIPMTVPMNPDDFFKPIESDVATTFVDGEASYYGTKDSESGAGNFKITMADFKLDNYDASGALVHVELFSDITGGKVPAAGTYQIGSKGEALTYVGGWIDKETLQDKGTEAVVSLLKEDGLDLKYGLANGGTVVIATEGDTYTITVDLTTDKGKTIKGKYVGTLKIKDLSYYSQLFEDKVIDLSSIPCQAFYLGQIYTKLNIDAQVWTLAVAPKSGPDGAQIQILAPAATTFAQGLPVGTYPVSFDYTPNGYLCQPGEYSKGSLFGSWYVGDISDGEVMLASPFTKGEVVITKAADGNYTIHAVATDDSPLQNTMDITWIGLPKMEDGTAQAVPSAFKAKLTTQTIAEPRNSIFSRNHMAKFNAFSARHNR